MNTKRKPSPSFFTREEDGSVRLRVRFDDPLASLIEEAAGSTPLLTWIYRTLEREARRQVDAARRERRKVAPPPDI